MARALASFCARLPTLLNVRLFSTSIAKPHFLLTLFHAPRFLAPLSNALPLPSLAAATRFTACRACRVARSGYWAYVPLTSESESDSESDSEPDSDSPWYLNNCDHDPDPNLPRGFDYGHWFTFMDKPGGEGATKRQMIDCYVQTLAKVVGSEQEAKEKIYKVRFDEQSGFACGIDEETSNKLKGLPGVISVRPDLYGGEYFCEWTDRNFD